MTQTLIHRVGEDACGGIAFWYDEAGAPEDRIEAERITLPDGTKPARGTFMRCGSCGAIISPAALDMLPGKFQEAA